MKTLIDFILGEILFDIDDLTPLGWAVLILALMFSIAVGVVSYLYLYPYLLAADIDRSNRKAYAFLIAVPFVLAAIAPLCIGVPILRRFGIDMTRTDAESRKYLTEMQIDSSVKQNIIFEIERPDEKDLLTLQHGLAYADYSIPDDELDVIVANKSIYPTLSRLSYEHRQMRELMRLSQTITLNWYVDKAPSKPVV